MSTTFCISSDQTAGAWPDMPFAPSGFNWNPARWLADQSQGTFANNSATPAAGATFVQCTTVTADLLQWFTPRLQAVTISGTVTLNIWALETNMATNAGAACRVSTADNAGNVGTLISLAKDTIELGLSSTAHNWTITPTSVALKDGERLCFEVGICNIGTMGSIGGTTLTNGSPTTGVDGDSFITFTETLNPYRSVKNSGYLQAVKRAAIY